MGAVPDVGASDSNPLILEADCLVIRADRPVPGGQILMHGGCVEDVGEDVAARHPGIEIRRFEGCVLMPGLVNAHAHLELTSLRGIGRGLQYPEWISAVTCEIKTRPSVFFERGAAQGVDWMLRGGITAVADHSTFGVSAGAIAGAGIRGVVFREVFCVDPDAECLPPLDEFAGELDRAAAEAGGRVEIGLSCHAPYNASQSALERIARDFKPYRRSIHACESAEEMSYVRSGEGVLADGHRARGISVKPRAMSPVEYLDNCGYWVAGTQAVHLTQASRGDMAILKARGASAAFCPSSNAALGVGIPPIAVARRAGLLCGLGTDSALSSERLDMFEEMRFTVLSSRLRSDPVSPLQAFQMATDEGARSLGFADAGALDAGRRADVVALRLPNAGDAASVVDNIVMQSSAGDVQAVWCGGRLAWSASGGPAC